MVALRKADVSVHYTDTVQVAFAEAMERIAACAPSSTLIASISQADWDSWDHSQVNPLVADSDASNNHDGGEVVSFS